MPTLHEVGARAWTIAPGEQAGYDGFRVWGHHRFPTSSQAIPLTRPIQETIKQRTTESLVKLTGDARETSKVEFANSSDRGIYAVRAYRSTLFGQPA